MMPEYIEHIHLNMSVYNGPNKRPEYYTIASRDPSQMYDEVVPLLYINESKRPFPIVINPFHALFIDIKFKPNVPHNTIQRMGLIVYRTWINHPEQDQIMKGYVICAEKFHDSNWESYTRGGTICFRNTKTGKVIDDKTESNVPLIASKENMEKWYGSKKE